MGYKNIQVRSNIKYKDIQPGPPPLLLPLKSDPQNHHKITFIVIDIVTVFLCQVRCGNLVAC